MPNVTGPIEMVLLEKDDRKYLLIADKHTPWNEGGCPPSMSTEILSEYLSGLFTGNPQNQWDFYLEQDIVVVDEKQKQKVRFLDKTKRQITPQDLENFAQIYEYGLKNNASSMNLTYDYFRSQGCFFIDESSPNKNRPECNEKYSNVRFHFINTRQANLGECKLPTLTKYIDIGTDGKYLYPGLFDVVTKMKWSTREELEQVLTDYIANYFYQVNEALKCLGERKIRQQFEKSIMREEIESYFGEAIDTVSMGLNLIISKLEPISSEIVNTVLLVNDKIEDEDRLAESIIGNLPVFLENKVIGSEILEDVKNKFNKSPYLRSANGVLPQQNVDIELTEILWAANKLIMDMYAMGRMTKPYNKNVVLLAGLYHYNVYLSFLTKYGFTEKWIGKPQPEYPKCITVPSFTPWHKRVGRFFGFKGGKPTTPPQSCCRHTRKAKKCVRKDRKLFSLTRKFTRKQCMGKRKQGYSMKVSCAPYKNCKKKKRSKSKKSKPPQFLYHPGNPDKSFDVYIDKNPKDTIPIKYSSLEDVRETIKKLERLYKAGKYSHKRIWQVGMIMKVRLDAIKKHHPHVGGINQRQKLAEKYFKFLGERTKTAKSERKKMVFTPLNN